MELTPALDPGAEEALYMQLYRSIREDILAGAIPAGSRLPSIRKLADRLRLSRTPVALAYEQLQAEGYVHSRPRSGLYVAELEGLHRGHAAEAAGGGGGVPAAGIHRSGGTAAYRPTEPPESALFPAPPIDFGYSAVDMSVFPYSVWKRLLNRAFLPGQADPDNGLQGDPGLRERIASYLHQTRGVRCTPEEIVIGAGTYHSLDLLFQLLQEDVPVLASEAAVNEGIRALFRRFGYEGAGLVHLPLEEDGLDPSPLYGSGARAVYLTPSHQFPFGMILSAAKRLGLLRWARERNAWLIENDYDGEFRYDGRPIPSLQGMDPDRRTVYVGTFSRALTPAFRISYMVLPPALLERFRAGNHSYDQLASPLLQTTLRLFMEEGGFERHMRRMRVLYGKKRDLLLEELRRSFGDAAVPLGTGSGLHVLLRLPGGPGEAELLARAARQAVRVYPVSGYALRPEAVPPSTVLLGFGGLTPAEIRTGVGRLAAAWRPLLR